MVSPLLSPRRDSGILRGYCTPLQSRQVLQISTQCSGSPLERRRLPLASHRPKQHHKYPSLLHLQLTPVRYWPIKPSQTCTLSRSREISGTTVPHRRMGSLGRSEREASGHYRNRAICRSDYPIDRKRCQRITCLSTIAPACAATPRLYLFRSCEILVYMDSTYPMVSPSISLH